MPPNLIKTFSIKDALAPHQQGFGIGGGDALAGGLRQWVELALQLAQQQGGFAFYPSFRTPFFKLYEFILFNIFNDIKFLSPLSFDWINREMQAETKLSRKILRDLSFIFAFFNHVNLMLFWLKLIENH